MGCVRLEEETSIRGEKKLLKLLEVCAAFSELFPLILKSCIIIHAYSFSNKQKKKKKKMLEV